MSQGSNIVFKHLKNIRCVVRLEVVIMLEYTTALPHVARYTPLYLGADGVCGIFGYRILLDEVGAKAFTQTCKGTRHTKVKP